MFMNRLIKVLIYLSLIAQMVLTCLIICTKDIVPLHWNYKGDVDSMGSPYMMLVLLVVSVGIVVLLENLKRKPELNRLPANIKDYELAYNYTIKMLDYIELIITLIMTYICVSVYIGEMFVSIIYLLSACLLLICAYYKIKISRL